MKLLAYDQLIYFWDKIKNKFVAKEVGKGLSTNDYSTADKNKLAGIEAGANKTVVDTALDGTSANPVQNKAIKTALDEKANSNHGIHVLEGGSAGQVLKKTASGYEWGADNNTIYTHPANHPATMITEDATHRFVTDTDKSNWNSKANGTHSHAIANVTGLQTALDGKIANSKLGQVNGVAQLDGTGKVPASQLPSYVDDVLEGYLYNGKFYRENTHTNEIKGEGGKIYVDLNTNYTYRFSGSVFVKIESVDIQTITNGEIDTICV